ncbi:effector binding domain-containing protein [Periweissella cryptocerci]|nr:effector binding domain-containing protein [Periweissella cryptocerci]
MMTDYTIETKAAFAVTAYGKALSMDKNPFELASEKAGLWQEIGADGRWDSLKATADNELEYGVNEAIDGQFYYYAGVQSNVTAPENTRVINFPAGEYLVIKATGTENEVWQQLDMAAFGEILPQANDFAYVGGPNANVQLSVADGVISGEKLIPIIRK